MPGIKDTPILTGEDAIRFQRIARENLSKKVSPEEFKRGLDAYALLMTNDRVQSNDAVLYPSRTGLRKLGIYINESSGNLFHGACKGFENVENRITPDKVWIDDDGWICIEVKSQWLKYVGRHG